MYLNRIKIESIRFLDNLLIGLAVFFYIFDIGAFVVTFSTEYAYDPAMRAMSLFMAVFFFLLPTSFVILSIRSKARLNRAEKYNRIFEEDHDGMVSYVNFTKLTGFSESTVRSDIRSMYHRNIFRNITYGMEGAMILMKTGVQGDIISVDCPNCGAAVQMRTNGGARCAHCGTYLRSES